MHRKALKKAVSIIALMIVILLFCFVSETWNRKDICEQSAALEAILLPKHEDGSSPFDRWQ